MEAAFRKISTETLNTVFLQYNLLLLLQQKVKIQPLIDSSQLTLCGSLMFNSCLCVFASLHSV